MLRAGVLPYRAAYMCWCVYAAVTQPQLIVRFLLCRVGRARLKVKVLNLGGGGGGVIGSGAREASMRSGTSRVETTVMIGRTLGGG
eukprot:443484-Pelagomonas_calceolata.AAC.9